MAFIAACGPSELTRDDAKSAISDRPEMQDYRTFVPHTGNVRKAGAEQGLWTDSKEWVFGERIAQELVMIDQARMQLIEPTSIDINVTGIRSLGVDERSKSVEFVWNYSNLPPLTKRFAVWGGGGTAEFSLYDDGWRLINLDVFSSPEPHDLAEAEWEELQADVDRVRAEETKRADLFRESWTPTKTLYNETYSYQASTYSLAGTVTITDVGLPYSYQGENCLLWFGNLQPILQISQSQQKSTRGRYRVTSQGTNGRGVNFILPPNFDVASFEKAYETAWQAWRQKYAAIENSDLTKTGDAIQQFLRQKGKCY